MNYPLENLDPERFQTLAQSLLLQSYPDLQSFPVGQPDGGRDAVSFFQGDRSNGFIVFQVKFVRREETTNDPRTWLLSIMKDEVKKISKLIPRGAVRYCLITNVEGTSHLDSGSIDRLNEEIAQYIKIPFECLWRDELNRRLDSAWDLKWAYPEIMTGSDFLRAILESGLSEERERRETTIRAFLTQQFKADEQVRFRQGELQRPLLDLFTDVPAGLRDNHVKDDTSELFKRIKHRLLNAGLGEVDADAGEYVRTTDRVVGAATLLLSTVFQENMPRIVLEGAPGQGKSTVSQYICQIHRLRLLKRDDLLRKISKNHKNNVAARLPIKVDLRDFATWLDKEDPFDTSSSRTLPSGWKKSLEVFIAFLIGFQAGGTEFSADDLLAVLRVSAVLIIFDGLDEVADIQKRQEVVNEIVKGVQRLEANAASLQTVITSRPAAFANSPGMPQDEYPHLQLLSLTRSLINQYADRWLRAKNVDSRESSAFKEVLKEKLSQPHLRDLARNPMQLAILLNLVLTRGQSLPDKRTALYDSYFDMFLNRESEKSQTVRQHRELLVDIHRFLGWLLHSESEKGNARGSISQERLHQVLVVYLEKECRDTKLVDLLFSGMLERVVALVSRVEGTYEFEVQPLREYFAARHLYDTAPYSPPGNEHGGTKPDRFDALARNFYWLNVTRFYAGCFSKGELSGLVERLQELSGDEDFRYTTHPGSLASTFLSDWVFMQNARSVKSVVDMILDTSTFRALLGCSVYGSGLDLGSVTLELPFDSGGADVLAKCLDLLATGPAQEFSRELVAVAQANSPNLDTLTERWFRRTKQGQIANPEGWLQSGSHLGVLAKIDSGILIDLIKELGFSELPIGILFAIGRTDILEASQEHFSSTLHGILDLPISRDRQKSESILDLLAAALDLNRYYLLFGESPHPSSLVELNQRFGYRFELDYDAELSPAAKRFHEYQSCLSLVLLTKKLSNRSCSEWLTEISPWETLVEEGRKMFGNRWAFDSLALMSSARKGDPDDCSQYPDLLDHSASLCRRARFARDQRDNKQWWQEMFDRASLGRDIQIVCSAAMLWMSATTLLSMWDQISLLLDQLVESEWTQVRHTVERVHSAMGVARRSKGEVFEVDQISGSVSHRFLWILVTRADSKSSRRVYERFLKNAETFDLDLLSSMLENAVDMENLGTRRWQPDLRRASKFYSAGAYSFEFSYGDRGKKTRPIPLDIAREIREHPLDFPSALIRLAEASWRESLTKKVKPVADAAERQQWFGCSDRTTVRDQS